MYNKLLQHARRSAGYILKLYNTSTAKNVHEQNNIFFFCKTVQMDYP